MDKSIFTKENIFFDHESTTQEEAFKFLATNVTEQGFSSSVDGFFEGLKNREKESTTGFKNGIAIPHSNDDSVLKAGLFVVKFDNPIEWNSLDKKPIRVAISLSIPKDGSKEHLKLLSQIARKLMDEDFTNTILNNDDPETLAQLIDQI